MASIEFDSEDEAFVYPSPHQPRRWLNRPDILWEMARPGRNAEPKPQHSGDFRAPGERPFGGLHNYGRTAALQSEMGSILVQYRDYFTNQPIVLTESGLGQRQGRLAALAGTTGAGPSGEDSDEKMEVALLGPSLQAAINSEGRSTVWNEGYTAKFLSMPAASPSRLNPLAAEFHIRPSADDKIASPSPSIYRWADQTNVAITTSWWSRERLASTRTKGGEAGTTWPASAVLSQRARRQETMSARGGPGWVRVSSNGDSDFGEITGCSAVGGRDASAAGSYATVPSEDQQQYVVGSNLGGHGLIGDCPGEMAPHGYAGHPHVAFSPQIGRGMMARGHADMAAIDLALLPVSECSGSQAMWASAPPYPLVQRQAYQSQSPHHGYPFPQPGYPPPGFGAQPTKALTLAEHYYGSPQAQREAEAGAADSTTGFPKLVPIMLTSSETCWVYTDEVRERPITSDDMPPHRGGPYVREEGQLPVTVDGHNKKSGRRQRQGGHGRSHKNWGRRGGI